MKPNRHLTAARRAEARARRVQAEETGGVHSLTRAVLAWEAAWERWHDLANLDGEPRERWEAAHGKARASAGLRDVGAKLAQTLAEYAGADAGRVALYYGGDPPAWEADTAEDKAHRRRVREFQAAAR